MTLESTCGLRIITPIMCCLACLVMVGCSNSSERNQLPDLQAAVDESEDDESENTEPVTEPATEAVDVESSAETEDTSSATEDEVESEAAGPVICTSPDPQFMQAMLDATNNARASARSCGTNSASAVPALEWNDALAAAAHMHSGDMAANNFFSHSGSDGLSAGDRITSQGYRYRAYGENIAAGYDTVQRTQEGWLNSPGHCENIMSSLFTQMGAACVHDPDSDYRYYWTVVFGDELN